jgi:hypothetical protein
MKRRRVMRLSVAQLHALEVAAQHRLYRSSMGWWNEDDEAAGYFSPATIKSLWRKGLLDGTHDVKPGEGGPRGPHRLWANERGRAVLAALDARDAVHH